MIVFACIWLYHICIYVKLPKRIQKGYVSEQRYFSGIPKAVQDVQRSGTAPCTRIGQDLLEVCRRIKPPQSFMIVRAYVRHTQETNG